MFAVAGRNSVASLKRDHRNIILGEIGERTFWQEAEVNYGVSLHNDIVAAINMIRLAAQRDLLAMSIKLGFYVRREYNPDPNGRLRRI